MVGGEGSFRTVVKAKEKVHCSHDCVQVSVLDAAAMGEVLESFIVSSTPIQCISSVPAFDDNDPDVLTSQLYTLYIQ